MERITLLQEHVGFHALQQEAENKLGKMEQSINSLLYRTRTPIDPIEVEYFRGFRQGVKYVIDALPKEIQAEFKRELAQQKEKT